MGDRAELEPGCKVFSEFRKTEDCHIFEVSNRNERRKCEIEIDLSGSENVMIPKHKSLQYTLKVPAGESRSVEVAMIDKDAVYKIEHTIKFKFYCEVKATSNTEVLLYSNLNTEERLQKGIKYCDLNYKANDSNNPAGVLWVRTTSLEPRTKSTTQPLMCPELESIFSYLTACEYPLENLVTSTSEDYAGGKASVSLNIKGWWTTLTVDNYVIADQQYGESLFCTGSDPDSFWKISMIEKALRKQQYISNDNSQFNKSAVLSALTGAATEAIAINKNDNMFIKKLIHWLRHSDKKGHPTPLVLVTCYDSEESTDEMIARNISSSGSLPRLLTISSGSESDEEFKIDDFVITAEQQRESKDIITISAKDLLAFGKELSYCAIPEGSETDTRIHTSIGENVYSVGLGLRIWISTSSSSPLEIGVSNNDEHSKGSCVLFASFPENLSVKNDNFDSSNSTSFVCSTDTTSSISCLVTGSSSSPIILVPYPPFKNKVLDICISVTTTAVLSKIEPFTIEQPHIKTALRLASVSSPVCTHQLTEGLVVHNWKCGDLLLLGYQNRGSEGYTVTTEVAGNTYKGDGDSDQSVVESFVSPNSCGLLAHLWRCEPKAEEQDSFQLAEVDPEISHSYIKMGSVASAKIENTNENDNLETLSYNVPQNYEYQHNRTLERYGTGTPENASSNCEIGIRDDISRDAKEQTELTSDTTVTAKVLLQLESDAAAMRNQPAPQPVLLNNIKKPGSVSNTPLDSEPIPQRLGAVSAPPGSTFTDTSTVRGTAASRRAVFVRLAQTPVPRSTASYQLTPLRKNKRLTTIQQHQSVERMFKESVQKREEELEKLERRIYGDPGTRHILRQEDMSLFVDKMYTQARLVQSDKRRHLEEMYLTALIPKKSIPKERQAIMVKKLYNTVEQDRNLSQELDKKHNPQRERVTRTNACWTATIARLNQPIRQL